MNGIKLHLNTFIISEKLNQTASDLKIRQVLKNAFHVILVLAFLFGFGLSSLSAQNRVEVTGTITDATDGSPLPGASIIVLNSEEETGSTIGTTSGIDGTFSLRVPENLNTLTFSFIGYVTQEVTIDGRTEVNVQLEPDIATLDDIVVVGYGSQRQREATGSVVSISEADFNQGVISTPEQLLQGRTAGVQITTASGEPGAGSSIRIRGTSSVRSGNQPLFVVDGVPLGGGETTPGGTNIGAGGQSARNPLSFLNPNDIESISILKDASAAAIYGARGANGVVLITTKTAAAGEPTLTVSSTTSISSVRKKLDLLSADEYVSAAERSGADPAVVEFGGATDWQDEIFRTGVSQDYYMGYGNGTETGSYRLSLGYADQQSIVESAAQERLTARVNATQRFLDDVIVLDMNLTGTRLNDVYAPVGTDVGFEGNLIGAALQANPTRPVYNSDGTYFQSSDFRNPVAMLEYIDNKSETSQILANLAATVNLTDWLAYKLNFGYENSDAVRRIGVSPQLAFPAIQESDGRAVIDNLYVNTQLIEHTLNLNRPMLGGNVEALAGFSYQRFERRGDWLQAEYFTTEEIPFVDNVDGVNNDGSNKAFQASSFRSVEELQSYFGRVGYNYDDRYMLTANLRVDGSTKFGKNNKYGVFPSLSGAWRISSEEFFEPLSDTFSDLKLRVGYGITGNQEFPGRVSLAIFEANNDGSITQVNNPNPDIQWEETAQLSVGVDFEIFQGRFGGSIDYFNKQTENLIIRQDYAQPAAVDYQWVNLDGTVLNEGWEFSVNAYAIDKANFTWQIDYNMSFLKNEVQNLSTFVNTGQIHGQGLTGAYAQRIAEGQPLFSFYMREFEGFDENGLGIYGNNEQLSFVGDALPDMTLGLTNTFNMGRWDLSAFLTGSFGFKVYNNTANAIFLKGNLRNGRNVTKDIANSDESANNFGEASTRFLEDGDYLRLANLTLGYNVDPEMIGLGNALRGLRLSVTGQNLFVITDYTGFDPEVDTNKAINGVPSAGIDYTTYPRPRTVSFNVRLDF
ncbi:SusC/RagA family TonB-linked outer membrane protein [Rhodohalobacter sp. 614A]|uniref:SusC/RagA family TonB-linked outer membrane protein n=1 Tax=Rhodohalobacter sp. 614A TaxID=2908649 RepID=UPI001F24C7F9|nr:SusC/RagA family TonB-linked outer membrane protein [Rhodohalobacter sp. 614A]